MERERRPFNFRPAKFHLVTVNHILIHLGNFWVEKLNSSSNFDKFLGISHLQKKSEQSCNR